VTVAIFCGSREWTDPHPIREALALLPPGSTVIHGDQRGADIISEAEAKAMGHDVIAVPADWELGPPAGPIRNEGMLKRLLAAAHFGQAVRTFAFHFDPQLGSGTRDMVQKSLKARVRVSAFIWTGGGNIDCFRSSGATECPHCGTEYWRHPDITSVLDKEKRPFLHLACDGRFLKL